MKIYTTVGGQLLCFGHRTCTYRVCASFAGVCFLPCHFVFVAVLAEVTRLRLLVPWLYEPFAHSALLD